MTVENYKKILYGEEPITTFLDERYAVEVELLNWPDEDRLKRVLVDVIHGHYETDTFSKLTKEQQDNAIQELLADGVLPKGMLMIDFTFAIKNISLTITHMIVRQKFFNILQKSTAVGDLRHESFVMSRAFARNKDYYERVKQWYLMGKELFCEGLDKHEMSVQDLRVLIPKNNCNHMYIHTNLVALRDAFAKRLDTCEEPIPSVIVCELMIKEIVKKFPWLKGFFTRDCDTGRCLHSKPGNHSNIVFKRDELHQKFLPKDYDLSKEITLHDKTRDEMNDGPEIESETYVGFTKK